ncbi:hypothetical protein NQ314_000191, partial [Rhamnusium bicolor]
YSKFNSVCYRKINTKISEKRKRVVLDLVKKFEVVGHLRKGESATSLSKIYNVPRMMINDLK